MTMVGGLDVHRQQITVDYVDNDGLVRWGQIRPATRKTLRAWLAEHCPDGDGELALEGCTGWRYVCEELAAAGVGVHLGDPAEIAMARGPKKRAKTDRADALARSNLVRKSPEKWGNHKFQVGPGLPGSVAAIWTRRPTPSASMVSNRDTVNLVHVVAVGAGSARRVSGEGHPGVAGLAEVAEHHGAHVDRGAQILWDSFPSCREPWRRRQSSRVISARLSPFPPSSSF